MLVHLRHVAKVVCIGYYGVVARAAMTSPLTQWQPLLKQ